METNATRQSMYDQIVSQPALLREVCDRAEPLLRQVLDECQTDRWRSIYTAGCGDSYYAGLACEMAFAQFCRLPVKALPSMSFARYEADRLPEDAVVFGISNSGRVARSIEAVAMANAAGADTIAVTGRPDSLIAQEAKTAIAVPIVPMGPSPGIRSYTVQLLSLLLCAIELGERRTVLSAAVAAAWRRQLRQVASSMEATIEANDTMIRKLAETLKAQEDWVFVGAGPSYATALFSAAKLVESCGANAWAQDLEEWAHIQFFNRQERTPTCFIIPPGPSVERAQELLPYVKDIGRYTLLVTHQPQVFDASHVDYMLTVPQAVPEVFSPLVDSLVGELLAYYLAEAWDTAFFSATRRGVSAGGDRLRGGHIWRQLETLEASRAIG
jgi:glucosamine--fructose-6-phosphate aminotransferase (isomerizing)